MFKFSGFETTTSLLNILDHSHDMEFDTQAHFFQNPQYDP